MSLPIVLVAGLAVTRVLGDNPKDVGNRVFVIYLDTMEKYNAQLAGAPEPTPELGAKLEAIKEAAVTELVELGRKIEKMSPDDRALVERTVRLALSGVQSNPDSSAIYENYQTAWNAYVGGDPEFFEKIKSLNILTQYAFFDLLREQEPEEADRLGV